MSALGHKQTFAVQNGMSALPPKADIGRRAPPRLKIRQRLLAARGVTAIMCSRLVFLLLGSASADKTWSLMTYGA